MEKILIVEDDKTVLDFEKKELEHEGYAVITAEDGRRALDLFESQKPDFILLDIMIPELNGIEVLRRIRKQSEVPVILVTAKGEVYDKVNGLSAGADDYISKPFAIEELLARISSVLRRSRVNTVPSSVLQNGEIELNTQTILLTVQDKSFSLSKIEFMLLKFFLENQNVALSRSQIIDAVWGKDYFIEEGTVDVYVNYLRGKIDQPLKEEYIKTVRGVGYMMVNKK
ncbi:MAG: response regulator transcription factor [Treponema sp.]|nr:response regulator transcription factor [Treponema sp.]